MYFFVSVLQPLDVQVSFAGGDSTTKPIIEPCIPSIDIDECQRLSNTCVHQCIHCGVHHSIRLRTQLMRTPPMRKPQCGSAAGFTAGEF